MWDTRSHQSADDSQFIFSLGKQLSFRGAGLRCFPFEVLIPTNKQRCALARADSGGRYYTGCPSNHDTIFVPVILPERIDGKNRTRLVYATFCFRGNRFSYTSSIFELVV